MKPLTINEGSPETSYVKSYVSSVHEGNKPYKCDRCEYRFEDIRNLYRHISSVHDGVRYKCVICESRFMTEDKLNSHISSVHERNKLFQCKMCDYRSSQKDNLFRHIFSIHDVEETLHKCPICNSEFEKEQDFIKHVSTVHERKSQLKNSPMKNESKLLNCKSCALRFINTSSLIQHLEKNHLQNTRISTNKQNFAVQMTKIKERNEPCTIQFVHKKHRIKSINSKQEKREISNCTICNSTFTQNTALTRHIELVHLKSLKIVLTKVEFNYRKKENFGTNKKLQENELPHHQTHETGTAVENLEDLKNNYNSKKGSKKPYKCKKCNKSFTTKSNLKTHNLDTHIAAMQVRNKKKKLFKCDTCYRCFTRKNNMKVHKKLNCKGEGANNPLICNICKSSFSQRGRLTEKGKKSLKCETCVVSFNHKGAVKCHMFIHEGKNPFQCTNCGNSFRRRNHFMRACVRPKISS